MRYGGHTPCVAVASDAADPKLVLDAGTGLQLFSKLLNGRTFEGTILLTHLHWDHTHGLPFFPAGDRDGARVTVVMPAQGDPKELMTRVISPPHFPIEPDQLRGEWTFANLDEGTHEVEGYEVLALEVPHKGGRTFGYRVSDAEGAIAYISDHSPISEGEGPAGHGEYHEAALRLAEDVDVLLHDAQYTAAEFVERSTFGHCTTDYAVELAERAGAKRVLLFHHDPARSDDELDDIVASYSGRSLRVEAATEGDEVDVKTSRG